MNFRGCEIQRGFCVVVVGHGSWLVARALKRKEEKVILNAETAAASKIYFSWYRDAQWGVVLGDVKQSGYYWS